MDDNIIKLIQDISNEVCPECGENSDCGTDPKDCMLIHNAIAIYDKFHEEAD